MPDQPITPERSAFEATLEKAHLETGDAVKPVDTADEKKVRELTDQEMAEVHGGSKIGCHIGTS